MASTPKPIRKEAKKIQMGLKKVDKSNPTLREYSRSKVKKERKNFAKDVAKLRLQK